jgi:hypothetical protein
LEKGLDEIKKFINHENGEIRQKYSYTAMLVALNDHAIQIQRALEEVKNEYDILIQSCMNAHKGVMQPQILSPSHLMQVLKDSQDSFPRDLQVPTPLSEVYTYQLINIVTVEVYIVDDKMVYVLKVPLTSHSVYDVYRILPFPIKVTDTKNKYTFIQPEKEIILMDQTKQFYVRLTQNELSHCRKISEDRLVCKQRFPIQISPSTSDCEALMLQPIRMIPKSCTQKILEIRETLWTPLKDNSWLFVAPVPDHLTTVCSGQKPSDIEIKDSGMLTFLSDCTGYGDKIMIRSITTHYVNRTGKDIIPELELPFDCCDSGINKINLDELQLESPIKNVLMHYDELGIASYKVSEVEKLIEEQEWKLKHSAKAKHLSVLGSIGAVTLGILISVLCCCCCCRRCRNCWPRFVKWFTDGKGCTSIVFKPKIINSVHTSSDSLYRRGVALRLATNIGDQPETGCDVTELTPMRVSVSPKATRSSSRSLAVGKR